MRSIDPCLFDTFYGYKRIENDIYLSIMAGSKPRSFASLIHYTRQSIKLGARLSLFRFTQSRTVGFRLIDFSAPIDTLRMKPPSPSSLGARLSLFRFAQSRKVGFRSMPGFHPPSIIPYRNHAYMKPINSYNP